MSIQPGLVLILIGSLFAGFGLTRVAQIILPRVGLVSAPDPNHPHPVPLGGGIVIWLTTLGGLLVMGAMRMNVSDLWIPFGGASMLFLGGLWDDARVMSPRTKLLLQFGAAVLMILGGVTFPLGPGLEWVAVPVTILWFVGLTNAFNLVDNMDGLLPGVAAVAALFVGIFGFVTGRPDTGTLALVACMACAGFLPANLPPAKIFLGDAGSMFLGFLLAGLAIGDSWAGTANLAFTILAPTLLLAVPIFNTTFVTITRKLSGVPLSKGKADHINYRLLAHGLSRGRALLAVYLLSAVSGTIGVLVLSSTPLTYGVGTSLFLILLMYLGVFLFQGRTTGLEASFNVRPTNPGWEDSPWYRWVIRVAAATGDVVLVFGSLYLAFALRFDGNIPQDQLGNMAGVLPYLILFRVGLALLTGVYETEWQLGMARDALRLIGTIALGTLLFTAVVVALRPASFPRAVVVMEGLLSLLFFGLTRMGVRALGEVTSLDWIGRGGARRTLIAGPRDSALTVLRTVRKQQPMPYHIIGLADDDGGSHRSLVGGIRVLGPASRIAALMRRYDARHVVFCAAEGPTETLERQVREVLQAGGTAEVVRLDVMTAESWLAEILSATPTSGTSSAAGSALR